MYKERDFFPSLFFFNFYFITSIEEVPRQNIGPGVPPYVFAARGTMGATTYCVDGCSFTFFSPFLSLFYVYFTLRAILPCL